jgi:hypothetical protein
MKHRKTMKNISIYMIVAIFVISCNYEKHHSNGEINNLSRVNEIAHDETKYLTDQLFGEIKEFIQNRILKDSIDPKQNTFSVEFIEINQPNSNKGKDTIIIISTLNCEQNDNGYLGVLINLDYSVAFFSENGLHSHILDTVLLSRLPYKELNCNDEDLIEIHTFLIQNNRLFTWDPGKPMPNTEFSRKRNNRYVYNFHKEGIVDISAGKQTKGPDRSGKHDISI